LAHQFGPQSPSHLTLMNMLARSAGFRNVQHLRAANAALRRLSQKVETVPVDARAVEKALHQFDGDGRLRAWPAKRSVQTLALWGLWAVLPAGQKLHENAINDQLNGEHLFGDPATFRRTLISCGLLTRNPDGSDYRRIEREPPAEAKLLIRSLSARRRMRVAPVIEPVDA
jgi:hypothetical protein